MLGCLPDIEGFPSTRHQDMSLDLNRGQVMYVVHAYNRRQLLWHAPSSEAACRLCVGKGGGMGG
jgi:hypothetical protein